VTPKRIQRKRAKGWRMPEGAVYVGRPSKWGNPYRFDGGASEIVMHDDGRSWCVSNAGSHQLVVKDGALAYHVPEGSAYHAIVAMYRDDLTAGTLSIDGGFPLSVDDARHELAGRDLACWCPLDQPCHADVLLEIANRRILSVFEANPQAGKGSDAPGVT